MDYTVQFGIRFNHDVMNTKILFHKKPVHVKSNGIILTKNNPL